MIRSRWLFPITNTTRTIHRASDLPKTIKELVFYGNNTLLFAAKEAIHKHKLNKQFKITIINSPFWLTNTSPDFLNNDWEQKIDGLSGPTRRFLLSTRPNYPVDRFITWRDYKTLHQKLIAELKTLPEVSVYNGTISSIDEIKTNWFIKLHNGKSILTDKNSYFYGWTRFPRTVEVPTKNKDIKIEIPSHTILYSKEYKHQPKEIIAIGHGLSIIWLLKHFPLMRIITVRKPGEKLPEVPSNNTIDIKEEIHKGRLVIIDLTPDIKLSLLPNKHAEIYHIKSGRFLYEAPIYSAAGFEPNHEVFAKIPINQKLLMPKYDAQGILAPNMPKIQKLIEKDNFISSKNVPLGSAPHSNVILMELTNNMDWADEPMFYFSEHRYERMFQKLKEHGIQVNASFFSSIDEQILSLENPLSPNESIQLYIKTFNEIYQATEEEQILFSQIVENMFANSQSQQFFCSKDTMFRKNTNHFSNTLPSLNQERKP